MPSDDSNSAPAPFRELQEQIASLAAAAKSLQERRPSWLENILHPGRQARREADFGASVVAALKKTVLSIQEARDGMAELERRLAELQGERLESFQTDLNQLRERQEQLGRAAQDWTDGVAALHRQFEQLAREQKERIDQIAGEQNERLDRLASAQTDLGNELRERIQHVLDEQRVAIRQLSLKASEDAILSDRARRAAELKMEELAKRTPAPPA